MGVKKIERGKALLTYKGFAIHQVPTYEGLGASRRMKTSTITIFVGKLKIVDGFKNPKEAVRFIGKNIEFYNKKDKKFNIPKTEETKEE